MYQCTSSAGAKLDLALVLGTGVYSITKKGKKYQKGSPLSKMKNTIVFILVITIAFYCALCLFIESGNVKAEKGSPLWDMASHGFAGVRIYRGLISFDPISLLVETSRQSYWPFVHSYLLAISYIFGGPTFTTATIVSVLAYFFVILLLFVIGKQISNSNFVGGFAAFLGLTSPMYMIFSSLIMLEIFGSLFILATFYFYFRAFDNDRPLNIILSGVFLTVTFFTKYNYGILLIFSILLIEYLRSTPSYKVKMRNLFLARLRIDNLKRPWSIFVSIYLLAIIATIIVKYPRFVGSIKNMLYILVFISTIRFLTLKKENKINIALIKENPRIYTLIKTTFLPILFWFLIPFHNKFAGFLSFLITGDFPSVNMFSFENFLYYFKVIKNQFTLTSSIFILLVVLFILSFTIHKANSTKIKALQIFFIVHILANMIHFNKIDRYIFTALPALWLVSSACFFYLISRVKLIRGKPLYQWIICVLIIYFLIPGFNKNFYSYFNEHYRYYFADNEVLSIAYKIAEETKYSKRIHILGTFNELSPSLLSWVVFLKQNPKMPGIYFDKLPKTEKEFNTTNGEVVVCIKLEESSFSYNKDYIKHNKWKIRFVEDIENNTKYLLNFEQYYPKQGIFVKIYNRTKKCSQQ